MSERFNERGAGRAIHVRITQTKIVDGERIVTYGLTVNREIALQFSGITLYPRAEDNRIIFESGAKTEA